MTRGKQITINSIPNGAELRVDGQLIGATPRNVTLTFGSHKIEIRNGSAHSNENIQVRDGGDTQYTYDVRETVRFKVTSVPSEAYVELDGKGLGQTPLTIRAKTGPATLTVSKPPRWATQQQSIDISESENFQVALSRDPAWG
ncbi:MAG: PEGA domain-containing protein [Bacteroidota bacterium]